ncbi:hypothetical protein CYJ37_03300 [Bacillus sp. UMB0728]|nr:hypothetical protein CYJ37_03300 [Bacillus sp. UMB0728]
MYFNRLLGYMTRPCKGKSCTSTGSWDTWPGRAKGSHVLQQAPGIHDPAVQREVMYFNRLLGYMTRPCKGKSCTSTGSWDT